VGTKKKLTIMAVVFLGTALIAAGAASAAAGVAGEKRTDPTPSKGTASSSEIDSSTETTSSTEPTLLPDSDTTSDTDAQNFGQIISGLREAGDHTPAAIIMGKEVPGWDPDRHSTATTTTLAASSESEAVDSSEGEDDEQEELGPHGSSGNTGNKDHVPAAVLMGKTVPGQSK
jgi:hypothetical protein